MRDITTVLLAVLMGFLIGTLKQVKQAQEMEGYEIISCKKLEQRGDTIITINKMVRQWE